MILIVLLVATVVGDSSWDFLAKVLLGKETRPRHLINGLNANVTVLQPKLICYNLLQGEQGLYQSQSAPSISVSRSYSIEKYIRRKCTV